MLAETGNPNSVTDAGVGALAARSAVMGASLNVKINASGLNDKIFATEIVAKAADYLAKAKEREIQLLQQVEEIIG